MSRHLAQTDGLFLGSSSAVNLVACVRLAKKWGPQKGKMIVISSGEFCASDRGSVADGRGGQRFGDEALQSLLVSSLILLACAGTDEWERRNDDYLREQGIPISSSIESILAEEVED